MVYDAAAEDISRICHSHPVNEAFKEATTEAYLNNDTSIYTFITPKESKRSVFEISYGFHSTQFGKCFLGIAEKGICHLSFTDHDESSAIEMLQKQFPRAKLKEDTKGVETAIQNIFDGNKETIKKDFPLFLSGTDFQIKVWKALTSIPEGVTTNYENIAHIIGKPKAVRATANAIANNPIAYLIPCHRIISKSGKIHKYRWGVARKKTLLDYEALKCIT